MTPYTGRSVSFFCFIRKLRITALTKNLLKCNFDFFRSVSLILVGSEERVRKCIKINDISQKVSIVTKGIGLAEDSVTNTKTTQSEVKEFSF